MKIMLDTNIIISAALFPNGRAAQAFRKALLFPYEPLICDYIVDELRRKFRKKFSDRGSLLEEFLEIYLAHIRIVPTPSAAISAENRIRDVKDRPILRAAVISKSDLFLTGDKDFLESSVENPKIISVSQFLSL